MSGRRILPTRSTFGAHGLPQLGVTEVDGIAGSGLHRGGVQSLDDLLVALQEGDDLVFEAMLIAQLLQHASQPFEVVPRDARKKVMRHLRKQK